MILAFAVLCVILFGLCAFTLASTVCICSLDLIWLLLLAFFFVVFAFYAFCFVFSLSVRSLLALFCSCLVRLTVLGRSSVALGRS